MKIKLENIGKRFNADWIFRGINAEFQSKSSYAILGANGSGKSTLLQIIAGAVSPSEGSLEYFLFPGVNRSDISTKKNENQNSALPSLEPEKIFSHLSLAAPYLDFPEEMTLNELVKFHFCFKSPVKGMSQKQIIETLELESAKGKQIKYFSSGMKQRVRLGLAILSNTAILLLDEPASHLDKNGIEWYRKLMTEYSGERLVVVCSNHQEKEYDFCLPHLLTLKEPSRLTTE